MNLLSLGLEILGSYTNSVELAETSGLGRLVGGLGDSRGISEVDRLPLRAGNFADLNGQLLELLILLQSPSLPCY